MTGSEPIPDEVSQRVNDALTEILGIHGAWVLAVETYENDSGEQRLTTMWDGASTKWAQVGLVHSLAIDIETPLRKAMGDD